MHVEHQDQVKARLGKLSLSGQIIFRTLKLKVTRTDITDTECLKYHRTKRIKAIQKDFEGSPLLGKKKILFWRVAAIVTIVSVVKSGFH